MLLHPSTFLLMLKQGREQHPTSLHAGQVWGDRRPEPKPECQWT